MYVVLRDIHVLLNEAREVVVDLNAVRQVPLWTLHLKWELRRQEQLLYDRSSAFFPDGSEW
jgi:hypothetical protein